MSCENLVTLNVVSNMTKILAALKSGHHGFPVVNNKNQVIGMISRNFIITLIQSEAFYGKYPNSANFEYYYKLNNKCKEQNQ